MKPDYLISIKASYHWSAADCTTTHRRLFSQRALVFGFRLTLLKLTPVRVLALKIVEPTSFIHVLDVLFRIFLPNRLRAPYVSPYVI